MGVAVGDFNNDGYVDLFITCVGQSRLFRNTGQGTFVDVTQQAGLGGQHGVQHVRASGWTSIATGSSTCSSATTCAGRRSRMSSAAWTAARSPTARPKRTAARPAGCSAIAATARSRTSRLRAASSTRAQSRSASRCSITTGTAGRTSSSPTTRSRTSCIATSATGSFGRQEAAGVAFSEDGKARAGMGVDAADFDNAARRAGDHQFRRRDGGAVSRRAGRRVSRHRPARESGCRRRTGSASAVFFADLDLDGDLDIVVVNGHIDDTVRNIPGNVGYAQAPHLFLNDRGTFRDVASQAGGGFEQPRVGRGWRAATSMATATSTC